MISADVPPAGERPWEILYEGACRTARYAGHLTDEHRRTWAEWLRRFGIDPNDVLVEPLFLVADDDARNLRYLGLARDQNGTPLVRGQEIERCVVTVQLEAPAVPFPGELPADRP